jgi:hypothetical protein
MAARPADLKRRRPALLAGGPTDPVELHPLPRRWSRALGTTTWQWLDLATGSRRAGGGRACLPHLRTPTARGTGRTAHLAAAPLRRLPPPAPEAERRAATSRRDHRLRCCM